MQEGISAVNPESRVSADQALGKNNKRDVVTARKGKTMGKVKSLKNSAGGP